MGRSQYFQYYDSPLGKILLVATDYGLSGAWFEGQKYYAENFNTEAQRAKSEYVGLAEEWLDAYFKGMEPDFKVPIDLSGTPFRVAVWEELYKVPWGESVSYGLLGARVAMRLQRSYSLTRPTAQAVAHNPVSIIVPCHRVLGRNGELTGYAGGLERKRFLLRLERIHFDPTS